MNRLTVKPNQLILAGVVEFGFGFFHIRRVAPQYIEHDISLA